MTLQEKFNVDPPDGSVLETRVTDAHGVVTGTGFYHIPILKVKEMLWADFQKWGTTDFKCTIIQNGHEGVIVDASCVLNLSYIIEVEGKSWLGMGQYSFVGATSFHSKRYAGNDNYGATALAECIKNAAKNIGRKFGSALNPAMYELGNEVATQVVQQAKKKDPMKAGIDNLLKNKQ